LYPGGEYEYAGFHPSNPTTPNKMPVKKKNKNQLKVKKKNQILLTVSLSNAINQ